MNQGNEYLGSENTITVNEATEAADNKFVAHHFDYRGLIEKGLALEAPKEMYKIE